MKKLLLTLLLCLIPLTVSAERLKATVVRVSDGDIIQVSLNGKIASIRLIGVDTPGTEINHPKYYGREAYTFTRSNLKGRTVYLEFDDGQRDRDKRLLAYVWLSEKETNPRKMFNSVLLLGGYARLMTIQPNVRYAKFFRRYQTEARKGKRGLWQ
jgi:micrococcal nuclease